MKYATKQAIMRRVLILILASDIHGDDDSALDERSIPYTNSFNHQITNVMPPDTILIWVLVDIILIDRFDGADELLPSPTVLAPTAERYFGVQWIVDKESGNLALTYNLIPIFHKLRFHHRWAVSMIVDSGAERASLDIH